MSTDDEPKKSEIESSRSPLKGTFRGDVALVLISVTCTAAFSFLLWLITEQPRQSRMLSVSLEPANLNVLAGEIVEFYASSTHDSSESSLEFDWSVGGLPFDSTPAARCHQRNATTSVCRFVLPGTFALAVTATDEHELSATDVSVVSVEISGGYIGISLPGIPPEESDNAYRELLTGIDWAEIQTYVSRPLVLYDPDTQSNVYAVSFSGDSQENPSQSPSGSLSGVRILIPTISGPAREMLQAAFERVGATLVVLPADEVSPALDSGLGEGFFVPMSRPDEIINQ